MVFYIQEDLPFVNRMLHPIISSVITAVLVIASIATVAGSSKRDIPFHCVENGLEVVDRIAGYIFWSLHCLGLLALPWLMPLLFHEVNIVFLYFPPVMMLLNYIGGFLPGGYECFPLVIEVIFAILLLFSLPFKSVYIYKTEKFWLGEITLMAAAFIYISAAIGASSLSYLLFRGFMKSGNYYVPYPTEPRYAITFIKLMDHYTSGEDYRISGTFLAGYSVFTFLAVGIGFAMSFRNSISMAIPFLMLAICTVIESATIGSLLFFQLLVHIIYIVGLQFQNTRLMEAGCICDCCYESCYATLTTIMSGDLIAFFIFIFPAFSLSLYGDLEDFPWGFFIAISIIVLIGIVFHFLISFDPGSIWKIIVAAIALGGSAIFLGIGFGGYVPMIRALTYEMTYLSWSFALCFWAYSNGYSPTLFKIYNGLISFAALIVIILYEGVGWMEILFAIVQIVFDTYFIVKVQRIETKYIAWSVFSISGVALLGFLAGVAAIILITIIYFVLSCLGSTFCESSAYDQAMRYAEEHGLSSGDTFECAGRRWKVE